MRNVKGFEETGIDVIDPVAAEPTRRSHNATKKSDRQPRQEPPFGTAAEVRTSHQWVRTEQVIRHAVG
jgi:hypothetical protein